jgi:hypothetical protein
MRYVIYSYNCFWALPEQSLSGPSPAELVTIFYCLNGDSLNLEGQVPIFISPRNRVAQLLPRALGILTRFHMGFWSCPSASVLKVKVKVILRPTVSRSFCLGVRHPFGTRDQFFSVFNVIFYAVTGFLSDERQSSGSRDQFLDSYEFADVWRPLWREVGSAVVSCCWALPAQSFSGLSP